MTIASQCSDDIEERGGFGIGRRRRILFVAEAVTLAHVARAHALAALLDVERYDVKLVCDPRYDFLFVDRPVARGVIHTIPTAQFNDALNRGSPIYQFETLLRYFEEDRRVIEEFDPDVVVGDFRISLGASARKAGKRYINVSNAGWSPYANPRYVMPDIALTRVVGARIGQLLFDLSRPVTFGLHAGPLNRLRRHVGLATLKNDLRHAYTDGDETLYADVPSMFPTTRLPDNHAFLGPLLWSARPPLPDWAAAVPSDRPLIYVALGSSGRHAILPLIVDALAEEGWAVVTATAGLGDGGKARPHVFSSAFLDGDYWASRANVVVCNGGSPTAYQALARGVPVLGIPSNLDQYLNMAAVADADAGILLRSGQVSRTAVVDGMRQLLGAPSYRNAAAALSREIAACDPSAVMQRAIGRAVDRSGYGPSPIH